MSAQPFYAWNARGAGFLLDGPSGEAYARRRIGRTQAFDGGKPIWRSVLALRCQAWNSGERIADVPHPPYHWQMDAIFSPVVAAAYSIMVQAMTCTLSSLW